ncbi:MOSC domain protein [Actinomadura rubteroloni]|uniref:MOSC domain protein n=1 Tax=Actinomadura rubteroloni TaxID=1926885 RepID=A0A2P4UNH4_9ACTN|nr:MOSC N-terminal beta barrel domain-containing protein [Actinomadura rubteroloni]POM26601.1 MOSC domain protein [Actinomadura rubteroloni]
MTATLTGLTVYPLKSGGGTPLTTAGLVSRGLRHDREFMLVDADGRFLSQRTSPEMALLRPAFDGEALTVAAPGAAEPLVHKATVDGPVRDVTVHGKDCAGVDQGDEAALWFGSVLGLDCRLVRFTGHRPTSRGGGELMFADGYPLLVISEESLDDLNARLDAPLPMDRFRPNLVLRGLGAYGEDRVRRLRVGGAVIEMVKPSARCVITTIDQRTAERGREPLRTLATYRMLDRGLLFGHNAVPRSFGTLTVGDPVEVLDA